MTDATHDCEEVRQRLEAADQLFAAIAAVGGSAAQTAAGHRRAIAEALGIMDRIDDLGRRVADLAAGARAGAAGNGAA